MNVSNNTAKSCKRYYKLGKRFTRIKCLQEKMLAQRIKISSPVIVLTYLQEKIEALDKDIQAEVNVDDVEENQTKLTQIVDKLLIMSVDLCEDLVNKNE